MPLQTNSWVEHWLTKYCAPGRHRWRVLRPDVNICERCFKEELTGGLTCIVCGIPGEHEVELVRQRGTGTMAGRLCGECYDEFGSRRAIKGWVVSRAS